MKLSDFLQGKWLGHPLHPAIVHVPLGLWTLAPVLDLVSWFGHGGNLWPRLAFLAVLLGVVTALAAMPPGLADWLPIKKEKPAWKLGLYHLILNGLATLVWAINLALRVPSLEEGVGISAAVLGTSLLGAVLVFAGGYLGSLLAFDHGTGVARQSKARWQALARSEGSRGAEDDT